MDESFILTWENPVKDISVEKRKGIMILFFILKDRKSLQSEFINDTNAGIKLLKQSFLICNIHNGTE